MVDEPQHTEVDLDELDEEIEDIIVHDQLMEGGTEVGALMANPTTRWAILLIFCVLTLIMMY